VLAKRFCREACRKEVQGPRDVQVKEEAAKASSGCEAVLADYSDKQSLRNRSAAGVTSALLCVISDSATRGMESNMLDAFARNPGSSTWC